jgi:phosphate transport system substrate-binding protein
MGDEMFALIHTGRKVLATLLLFLAMPSLATAQGAESKTLFCLHNGTQIAADRFETRDGKFYLYIHGSKAPLEYPASQITGVNTPCKAAAPVPHFGIHGSNTIGERLMPMLIETYGNKYLKTRPLFHPGKPEEQEITLLEGTANKAVIDFRAHGSGTAAKGLVGGTAIIGMASRQLKPKEADAINVRYAVDAYAPRNEHVLALDGLAIIVNKANPVKALSLDQIARIFSGEFTSWSQVGGPALPINVHRRDDKSGTYDTFKSLVLKPSNVKVTPDAKKYESSEGLSAAVAKDPGAIGFVALPYIDKSRALSIASTCGLTSAPSTFTIKTESYPLARRLYLYTIGAPSNPVARELLKFALSDEAQPIITEAGYVDQAIEFQKEAGQRQWVSDLIGNPRIGLAADQIVPASAVRVFRLVTGAMRRTSLAFRFKTNSDQLDTRAQQDVERLARYLRSPALAGKRFFVIGFADAVGTWEYNHNLALRRASAVATQLRKASIQIPDTSILTMSFFAPVACNNTKESRAKNRRVEVWITK